MMAAFRDHQRKENLGRLLTVWVALSYSIVISSTNECPVDIPKR